MGKLLYSNLTYKIISILYKVHNKLGPTYQEKHYQRAIEKELLRVGLIANFKKDKLQLRRLILPKKYLQSV